MKIIVRGKRHRYLRMVGSLFIATVLLAGILSCVPNNRYVLTVAVNPAGGGNATDDTDTSPYAPGTVVSVKAVAAVNYQFGNWSAPAGTFDNSTAATTNFTMPAQHVTVTANFVETYTLTMATSQGFGTAIDLTDASPYAAGTVVSIKAEDNWQEGQPGIIFIIWQAPAGIFGDEYAKETTFIMPAQNVTVTAHFTLYL